MKFLSLFILLALFSCKEKPKVTAVPCKKPTVVVIHAVHSVCADVWAVKTINATDWQRDLYWGKYTFSGDLYTGQGIPPDRDSSLEANIPNEYQFKDSATAMAVFNDYYARKIRPSVVADSLDRIKRHIADSIEKCKHTYQ